MSSKTAFDALINTIYGSVLGLLGYWCGRSRESFPWLLVMLSLMILVRAFLWRRARRAEKEASIWVDEMLKLQRGKED